MSILEDNSQEIAREAKWEIDEIFHCLENMDEDSEDTDELEHFYAHREKLKSLVNVLFHSLIIAEEDAEGAMHHAWHVDAENDKMRETLRFDKVILEKEMKGESDESATS